jgi:hypothetical protein
MVAFGAYHGLNPGMGWLFALALGLQQRSSRAIWVALGPIAVGHAASLAVVAVAVLALGAVIRPAALELAAAALLLVMGGYKLLRYYRHPRWVGVRMTWHDLVTWSFLMATAHGAGLMAAPVLVEIADSPDTSAPAVAPAAGALALAVTIHTGAMLVVMAAVAWLVYHKLGLAVLRRGWINFDLIWAAALLVVGALALTRGLWAIGV